MFLEIVLIAIYIIFAILLIDLFYADLQIQYSIERKKNIEKNMNNENPIWISKKEFYSAHNHNEYMVWFLSLIPLINIAIYLVSIYNFRNSKYENSKDSKLNDIMMKTKSINSFILIWIP